MRDRNDWVALELTKQKHRLDYIKTTLSGGTYCPQPPRRIFIEPTNHCNANCIHCVHDGTMTRKKGFMDMALYRKVFDDIKHLNDCCEICLFQHGDPLLHPDIVEMSRISGLEHDFFTKLNTNGIALTKKLSAELIANGLDYIVFSLDAITPETFKRVKRKDCFDKVLKNILDYMEVWGELDTGSTRNYFACDINILEEDANRHEIPTFTKMFEKLPVGHVATYELHNFTGAVEEGNQRMTGHDAVSRENWPCCNTPWDVLAVRWNGDVVACIYDYDSRYVIGNVNDDNLLDIWNSDTMQIFRQALLDRDYSKIEENGPLCSECSIHWMEEYTIPSDYYKEIARMEQYLSSAIDRVANRWPRTEELLKKWEYLKENRQAWLEELKVAQDKLDKRIS